MGDGRSAERPQPAQPRERLFEQRVAGEAPEELRVVVVEAEDEPDVLDARLAVGTDADRAVRALPGRDPLETVSAAIVAV